MKKRCFYLDFIRAIAVISILMTHYNAVFIYMNDENALKKAILTTKVANIYIGDFGVSLFLIISGAALMYTYENKLELKTFYKKRALSIYPMFWIGYFIVFCHSFMVNGGINQGIPKWRILLSVIGMDGYIGMVLPSFYLIGEWFLGFIIIIYIIFPLLRKGILDKPVITLIITVALYVFFMLDYRVPFIKNIFLFIRLPEIVFGMFFVKYIKKVDWKWALVSLLIIVANSILKPDWDASFQMTYIGISFFCLLTYVSRFIENKIIITRICQIISKYSYAVFLVHHYIINIMVSKVDLNQISILESYILFLIICCVIGVFAKLLYTINTYVIEKGKKYYVLVKAEKEQ